MPSLIVESSAIGDGIICDWGNIIQKFVGLKVIICEMDIVIDTLITIQVPVHENVDSGYDHGDCHDLFAK